MEMLGWTGSLKKSEKGEKNKIYYYNLGGAGKPPGGGKVLRVEKTSES